VEKSKMKLWLDDQRPAPPGFERAKTTREAIRLIVAQDVDVIAFDHDLGAGLTGYDVACLIEDMARDGRRPPSWSVHSSDKNCCRRINAAMLSAHKIWRHHGR
jgi:hypothetical protein